jgi:hypothetical protein
MLGFKAFGPGLQGINYFKYEVGKVYEIKGELEFCANGFHFCPFPLDVDKWYEKYSNVEYAVIEALGNILHDTYKSITSKIKIIKRITREELLEYVKDGEHVLPNGDIYQIRDKRYHSDNDIPAIELKDGDKYWYKNGMLHRNCNKPAVVCANGDRYWYVDNMCQCTDR